MILRDVSEKWHPLFLTHRIINTGHDGKLSVVPMDGMHMRFALMLRMAWELYLSHGKDVNFGDISSVMYL